MVYVMETRISEQTEEDWEGLKGRWGAGDKSWY